MSDINKDKPVSSESQRSTPKTAPQERRVVLPVGGGTPEQVKSALDTYKIAKTQFEKARRDRETRKNELEEKRAESGMAEADVKAEPPFDTQKKEPIKGEKSPEEVKMDQEKVESEKNITDSLSKKHDAQLEDVMRNVDIGKMDSETKGVIYKKAIAKTVDISQISDVDKRKALEGLKKPDGTEIDLTKLTPEQEKIVRDFQANKYLSELKKLSDVDKKDINKLKELASKNLGIVDFSISGREGILNEEKFGEAVKKNPELLSGIIESIKEDGILLSGINPESELGKKLMQISQENIDEFRQLFPEENDIKKISDIFGGTYLDILAGAKINGLEKFQDSILRARESLKSGELGGVVREDYASDKEYSDALNKAAKDATGMDYQRLTKTTNTFRRSGKMNPFLKFLADLLAPIGALMSGDVGEFWRNYLRQGNDGKDVAGGSFDRGVSNGGQKFEKLKNTSPDAFLQSASKYLGWPYKYGANGSSKETGIDCSQLVVNSLIDEGCLPKGYDTSAMGFAQRSNRLGDDQGKKGDFLILGEPSPHIAIIAEDPAPGSTTYKTLEATSSKGGVVYTQRTAGKSFKVYQNPFFEGATLAQNKEGKETFNILGTPVTITPPLHPKNLSDRNKNPLNIKSNKYPGDTKGHSICPSYEAGITIAVEDLQKKLNGQSNAVRKYTGGRDAVYVRDVIGTWAPESDGNNPNEYTRTVLSRMGFSGDLLKIPVSAVQNRIPELVLQMAKVEGCQASFEFGGGH